MCWIKENNLFYTTLCAANSYNANPGRTTAYCKWLKKKLKKLRLDWEYRSNPDLCDDRTQFKIRVISYISTHAHLRINKGNVCVMYSYIGYITEESTMACSSVGLHNLAYWIITSVASGQARVQPFTLLIQLPESFPFSYDPVNFAKGFGLVTEKNSATCPPFFYSTEF